jgi:hypothetical protein
MNKQSNPIKIKTGIDAEFLETVLTRDTDTATTLFELIDNAVDAAKEDLLLNKTSQIDEYGLPKNYKKYKITVKIGKNKISVQDNCSGMTRPTLSKHAMLIGKKSARKYGIGYYGIGLKRALLKFGRKYYLKTGDGNGACEATFERDSINKNGEIGGVYYNKATLKGTLIEVSALEPEIVGELKDARWQEDLKKRMEMRYSLFLRKGLTMTLQNDVGLTVKKYFLQDRLPQLRGNGCKIQPIKKRREHAGLNVWYEGGIHADYYYSGEAKHAVGENKKLTNECGIYYVCNDRVVIESNKTPMYGLGSDKWHNEYNGLVVLVRMTGDTPEKIPWNTDKTNLQTGTSVFRTVRDEVRPLSAEIRTAIRENYLPKKGKHRKNGAKAPVHPQVDNFLFGAPAVLPFEIPSHEDKLRAVVNELSKLAFTENPYAILLLLRVLIECCCKYYSRENRLKYEDGKALRKKVSEIMSDIHKDKECAFDKNTLDRIKSLCSDRTENVVSIEYLQNTIHSSDGVMLAPSVREFWIAIRAFVEHSLTHKKSASLEPAS